jgi:DNA-binding NtrC family response regulator
MNHENPNIVAKGHAILNIMEQLNTIALSDRTVLFIGETGVGKDRFAEYLHGKSVRRFKPLVKIAMATLPRELVESELFGHEKGAFTGAAAEKKGLFEAAEGGSLLLDDIDDLPIEIQPKLLRAMEAHEIQRVGGIRTIKIDVRFIAASKVSLKDLVDQGKFRADLFYRLNVVPITIPPLRDRREDIPALIEHYLKFYLPEKKVTVSKEALRELVNYSWPGNVRELVNAIGRVLLFANDTITLEDLPHEIRGEDPMDMLMKSCSRCFFEQQMSYEQIIACLETNLLRKALEMHQGNKSRAADFLGLRFSTFRDKLVKYRLNGNPITN